MKHRALFAALGLLSVCFARTGNAQTLGVQGDHFTVDGAPKFLLFMSYVDAMRRANASGLNPLAADLTFFATSGFDGIRIFPNWWAPSGPATDSLIDSTGTIRDATHWSGSGMNPWARFVAVLDAAQSSHLLVDVTFTKETVALSQGDSAFTAEEYKSGIRSVVTKLQSDYPAKYLNVFFDAQNEWTAGHMGGLNASSDVQDAVTRVHSANAASIATGSQSSVSASTAGSNAATLGFDVVTFHDGRVAGWSDESTISGDISSIRLSYAKPILYDEPTVWCPTNPSQTERWCQPQSGDDTDSSHFGNAAKWAKKHGAALWTFYTRDTFDLATSAYTSKASSSQQAVVGSVASTAATGLKQLVAGTSATFTLTGTLPDQFLASLKMVSGRSYCGQVVPGRTSVTQATPRLAVFRADGTTSLGSGVGTNALVCFIAPATETARFQASQAETGARIYRMGAFETTLWSNWFYVGGNYSSFTILRNTTKAAIAATITWRDSTGATVATVSTTLPGDGTKVFDARGRVGTAIQGSVEVAHNGPPQGLVGSQTTLSPMMGLSFDTLMMSRLPR